MNPQIKRISSCAAACAALLASTTVSAQDFNVTDAQSEYDATNFEIVPDGSDDDRSDNIVTWIGVAVTLGVTGSVFLSDSLADQTDPGLGAEGRVIIGTHFPVALELGAVGTANNIEDNEDDNAITSFGADARLRANFSFSTLLQPFIFGGVGWKRYDLVDLNDGEQGGDVVGEDDILELPVGAGVAMYWGNFTADVRGTWRPSFYTDAEEEGDTASASATEAGFDNVNVGVNVGVVF